jgi:hypothetical protein
VEVAIRERRPEDVVVASLEGVAVDAAYADDATTRAVVHARARATRLERPHVVRVGAEIRDDHRRAKRRRG